MKKIKFFLLFTVFTFLLIGSNGFAHPRYRIHRVYYVKPVNRVIVVKKVYKIKKPKIHHKHHKKVVKRIIYY